MNKILFRFLQHHWPIVAIILLWFIFASPYFLKGLLPFPSRYLVSFFPPWSASYGMPVKNNAMPDVISQIYPWKRFTIETWKSGYVPLWNPYVFSGTAHAANYQTAVFSPFNLLFFLFSEQQAWSLLVLLQPLLAGVGMYMFLKGLGRSLSSIFIGSAAYMFCGFMVVWMAYGTLGYAVAWLPFILFSIHTYFLKKRWWAPLSASFGLVLSFTSGHFQMSVYVLIFSFFFLCFNAFQFKNVSRAIVLGVALIAGLCIVSPQLLITYDAYKQSIRSGLFGSGEVIPFRYLLTIFAPDLFGNPVTRNDWFGHYAEWASFIGITPLLLAVYALFQKKNRETIFFICMFVGAVALATPTPFVTLLFFLKIPAISTSAASRIIVLASFSLCVLSSIGMQELELLWGKKSSSQRWYLAVVMLFIVSLWVVLFIFKPIPADKLVIAKRNLVMPSVFAITTLLGIALSNFSEQKRLKVVVLVLFCFLSAFDVLRYASKWMPFEPKEFMYPVTPAISFLKKTVSNDRVFGNFGNELATSFHIPSIEGYDALYQERYGELIKSASNGKPETPERSVVLFPKYGAFNQKLLNLMGVTYHLHRLSDGRFVWEYPYWRFPGYTSVYKDDVYEVLKNTVSLPRTFLVYSYVIKNKPDDITNYLYAPTTNLRDTVVLEQKPQFNPTSGEGKVEFQKNVPNEIVLKVTTTSSGLVFLSDVFDQGWKVTIDGARSQLLRADFDFRAVSVAKGSHIVRMYYLPDSFRLGLVVAVVGVGVLLCVSIYGATYEHRDI